MPLSIDEILQDQDLQIYRTPHRTMPLSIERMLQNLKISGSTSLRSPGGVRQIDIQCPPRQRATQHYGYRVDEKYMLMIESKIRADPAFNHDNFYSPMHLARKWIAKELMLYQLDFAYCHDPERRPCVPLSKEWEEHLDGDEQFLEREDQDKELFVVVVLAVCSDDPCGFRGRPTQAQLDKLTSLLGSQPQWWVGYEGWSCQYS
ncbi:hypothetical protein K503DRAFT_433373 [Rhizopogon vinicolor AM-OR11-026]|uniref:Uncharacterized protein n=1 Tax=Rhizopogon vinicolor AM-OR11-026 TaxID=1314800 RepID=A0A1B7MPS8_9AGAM|nr:hypothetical protein K503DRAFT_433373 [Rhizopogon vinicolor AM-OR11-026]